MKALFCVRCQYWDLRILAICTFAGGLYHASKEVAVVADPTASVLYR